MMILSRLADYLKQRQQASLLDMSIGLDTDAEALRGMLEVLQRKGRVRKLPSGTACSSGCSKCHIDTVELYAWSGEAASAPTSPTAYSSSKLRSIQAVFS